MRVRGVVAAVALALGTALPGMPAGPIHAASDPCTGVRLEARATVSGDDLADCVESRMSYASSYFTRIAATGDTTTYAIVALRPMIVRASRGSEHVRVTSRVPEDESLFGTFVRTAAPPDQLATAARSAASWTVVRPVDVLDAEGTLRPSWRLVPTPGARFDDTAARRVSLHLESGFLPVRFRVTTSAIGFEVTYTQRWSEWGARLIAVCDDCAATSAG